MKTKYLVLPGPVVSKYDGDLQRKHYEHRL